MTLDDFFTLSEINKGLTSPSRVRELVAAMQDEKDSHAQNGVDSTRQWSAAATAVAATDKKECLDLFIQLDGLHFLDNWLKCALNISSENTVVEDLITLFLKALEKLPIDYEKLVASGILITVENLLAHNSSKVQDKARDIYQSWKKNSDGDVEKKTGASSDHAVGIIDVERGTENSNKGASLIDFKGQESTTDDPALATCSEAVAGHVEAARSMGKSLDAPIGVNRPSDVESCSLAVLETTCDVIKHTTTTEISAEKEISFEESNTVQERPMTSLSNAADAMKSENELPFANNMDKDSRNEDSLYIMSSSTDTGKNGAIDGNVDQPTTSKAVSPKTDGDFKHPILRGSSSTEKSLTDNYNFTKDEKVSKNASDMELDSGIIDPLDVARQVAMEVEKETANYKEKSCSSLEKVEVSDAPKPDIPDVMNKKESPVSEGSAKHIEIDQNYTSPTQEESAASAETLESERANVTPDMESSQVTETAQDEVNNSEKEVIGNFDLNQEVCSEDVNDHPSNQLSPHVSSDSASKEKAAPKQPAAPLLFEGNLGWKGSASTSAFRPASLRRMLENDKTSSSASSSKQRQVCLDIDLNVAESVDGESCLDTNSRKYEHLELDLNHASEDDGPSDWKIGQLFPQGNRQQSRSHSSSSSVKQPSLMNFDLNGQPSFLNDSSYLSQNNNVSEGLKSDDSVISIMGTRVQVNRKDVTSQVHPSLNGQKSEVAVDLNLGRSGNNVLRIGSVVPYTHTPFYGYNNIASEPAPVFAPVLYGSGGPPIPYMVDSRVAPVVPQLVGSVSALPTAYTQPHFAANSSNPSNAAGPSGPSGSSFNLNYGMVVESGSEEPVGFRQFLSSGHIGPMGEQRRSSAQPAESSVGGKRKEPENEWENCPPRQYMPHWK